MPAWIASDALGCPYTSQPAVLTSLDTGSRSSSSKSTRQHRTSRDAGCSVQRSSTRHLLGGQTRHALAASPVLLLFCLQLVAGAAQSAPTQSPSLPSAPPLEHLRRHLPHGNYSYQRDRPEHVPVTVPVDSGLIASQPAVASVPVGPPPQTSSSSWKFDFAFSEAPQEVSSGDAASAEGDEAAGQRYARQPIAADAGFITAQQGSGSGSAGASRRQLRGADVSAAASKFLNPDGSAFYPGGTSWFNMMQLETFSEAQIVSMLNAHYQKGVRVLRVFGHNDGYGTTMPVKNPIQPRPGVFNETALQRFDFVMNALAETGIRLITTLTNFWPEFGGMGWYVDNILGPSKAPELFYSSPAVIAAYQTWVRKITTRVNTVNGRIYSQDPTIFSWELCNECHTDDNYEVNNNIQPGSLVYNWEVQQAAFLKHTIGVKQMVSNGNEGYRAWGPYDPNAPLTYPFLNWMNSGLKGEDFVRNLGIKDLDFATIHVYPSNWGVPAGTCLSWLNNDWIGDRAALAAAAGKPLVLEEFGMPRGYYASRDTLFSSELSGAYAYGLAGTMVWEVWPVFGDDSGYDFDYAQSGSKSVLSMLQYQAARTAGHAPRAPSTCTCSNVVPDPGTYTCAQQAGFGKCCASWMINGNVTYPDGYCQNTCKRCKCNGGNPNLCTEKYVPSPTPHPTPHPAPHAAPHAALHPVPHPVPHPAPTKPRPHPAPTKPRPHPAPKKPKPHAQPHAPPHRAPTKPKPHPKPHPSPHRTPTKPVFVHSPTYIAKHAKGKPHPRPHPKPHFVHSPTYLKKHPEATPHAKPHAKPHAPPHKG